MIINNEEIIKFDNLTTKKQLILNSRTKLRRMNQHVVIIILSWRFLKCLNTMTDSRAPYKPELKIRCMQQGEC